MISLLPEWPDEIRSFRKNPWPFQQTFKTPLKDLKRFVSTFVGSFKFQRGVVNSDEIVFEPSNLLDLFASNSVQVENHYDLIIRVEGHETVMALLEATLGDWVDFAFVPFPEI